MLSENKNVADKLGITAWHNAGYTGKRGLSISFEYFDINNNLGGHGLQTAEVFKEFAPDRQLITLGDISDRLSFIRTNKPDTGFRSLPDYDVVPENVKFPDDIMDYCSLFNSAGNESDLVYSKNIDLECWFGVGAVSGNDFTPTNYSSRSVFVDFASVAGIYIKSRVSGISAPFDGTSCSAPLIAAMCALVNDFFIDKIGRPLTHAEMFDFIKANCIDVPPVEKDDKTGYGVFVLPDPATINPLEWINMEIKMTLGSNAYTVDGVLKTMDVAPFAQGNRTFVPIRFIAEALGCTVDWDDTTQTVTIKR